MSLAKYAFWVLLLIGLAGCTRPAQESGAQQPPATTQQTATQAQPQQAAPESAPAPEATKPAVSQKPTAHAAAASKPGKSVPNTATAAAPIEKAPVAANQVAETVATPKPPEPKFATIADGTKIQVRLQDPLDSAINKSGDKFRTILDKDIIVDGTVVAPRGSILDGKLLSVERSGRVEGRAAMSMQLTSLTVRNQIYPLQTDTMSFQAESTVKKDATKVGIGAGLGAVIGAIAGGGKGAAIGAAVGGGAGGAAVVATRGKEVKFDAEQAFSFVLRDSINVKLQ
jgi:hypothetical protein